MGMPANGRFGTAQPNEAKRFKLLRVLHLKGVEIEEFLGEIGKLVHLRYICCKTESMRSLPSSMVNLQNLQMLYLTCKSESGFVYIPSAVRKMLQQLRHLRILAHVDHLAPPISPSRTFSQLKSVLSVKLIDMLRKLPVRVTYEESVTLEQCIESSLVSELYVINRNLAANSSSSTEGLKFLTNLKTLGIVCMPSEFKNRLQSEIGEDWRKIQHIPTINITDSRVF
ncbi:hypothetical protein ACLOJK_016591 [Asimina triloba]